MSIDQAQPIPLYYQLKTLLLEEILSGRYGPEGRLPTEHELCEHYGITSASCPFLRSRRERRRPSPAP